MTHTSTETETETFDIVVGDRGRIVLPAAVRKRLNLKRGDRLHARIDKDGNVQITDKKAAIASLWGMLVPSIGGLPVVDEFIEDRRKEAASE